VIPIPRYYSLALRSSSFAVPPPRIIDWVSLRRGTRSEEKLFAHPYVWAGYPETTRPNTGEPLIVSRDGGAPGLAWVRVKALSADGTLARAGVVHFATHGLVAGESTLCRQSC